MPFSFGENSTNDNNPFAACRPTVNGGESTTKPNLNFSFGKSEGNPFADSSNFQFDFGNKPFDTSKNLFSLNPKNEGNDKMEGTESETATPPAKEKDPKEEAQPTTTWVAFGANPVKPFEYFTPKKDE